MYFIIHYYERIIPNSGFARNDVTLKRGDDLFFETRETVIASKRLGDSKVIVETKSGLLHCLLRPYEI
jgi:hypothetical protein